MTLQSKSLELQKTGNANMSYCFTVDIWLPHPFLTCILLVECETGITFAVAAAG